MAINLPTIDESKVRIVGALGDHPNVDNNMPAQDLRDAFDQDSVNIREFLNPTVAGSFGNVLKTKIDSMETDIASAQQAATGTITSSRIGSVAVTTGKIGSGAVTTAKLDGTAGSEAVTTAKIRAKNVTRAKLADDALYTPLAASKTSSFEISADDLGKMYPVSASSANTTVTLTAAVGADAPSGAEFAFFIPAVSYDPEAHWVRISLPTNAGRAVVNGRSFSPMKGFGNSWPK